MVRPPLPILLLVAWLPLPPATPCAAQPPAVVPVAVAPVVRQEVASGETFVGTLLADRKATIGTAVDGRVIEILVEEGDFVRAEQPLARLLTDTIRLEHEAALAELEFRQQQLNELVNGTRPDEIERAEARMQGAEASMNYLRNKRSRAERLYKTSQAASEEDLDAAVAAAVQAEQAYRETKATYDLAVEGPRQEQVAQARAQVRMQQALVERLADMIRKHTLVSRFDGYVTAQHTEIGAWVARGDPVFEVISLDPIEVKAYVLEKHIPFVKVGAQARVEVPALPERVFTGEVSVVIPDADVRARTFPVRVRVPNTTGDGQPLLKSGMYARVTLPTGPRQTVQLVPKDAVVLGGPQPVVYLVEPGPQPDTVARVRAVPVQLGVASGVLIQVGGDLPDDAQVVVRGNERLRPGQEVRVAAVLQSGDGS
jgi:RND family efflux transporter MFP subunit